MPAPETFDTAPIRQLLDAALERGDCTPMSIEQDSGIAWRTIYEIRAGRRPSVTLGTLDALCRGLGIPIEDALPGPVVSGELVEGWCSQCRDTVIIDSTHLCPWCSKKVPPGKRRGHAPGSMRCITPELLTEAYRLYAEGLSLRQVAARVHPQTTYKSTSSCANGLHGLFVSHGWKTRSRSDVLRARNFKHGKRTRAMQALKQGDPGYEVTAAYRREQRERAGIRRGVKCAGTNKSGGPCSRYALTDSSWCFWHDPARAQERAEILDMAHAASRARMVPWSTVSEIVERAIATHGAATFARAASIDVSSLARLRTKAPDAPSKPEICERLRNAALTLDPDMEDAR